MRVSPVVAIGGLCLATALSPAVACSSSDDTAAVDAGAIGDAAQLSVGNAGDGDGGESASILTPATTSLHFERKGGLPEDNSDASCSSATASVTLDLIAHSLTYTLCSATSAANLAGTVHLSDDSFQVAVTKAQTMRIANIVNGGEDVKYATVAASTEGGVGPTYFSFTAVEAGTITTATNIDATLDQLLGLILAACPWLPDCH